MLLAIWDNGSIFHFATFEYDGLGERFGNRVLSSGERLYFDSIASRKPGRYLRNMQQLHYQSNGSLYKLPEVVKDLTLTHIAETVWTLPLTIKQC